jgi:hypothetical protein
MKQQTQVKEVKAKEPKDMVKVRAKILENHRKTQMQVRGMNGKIVHKS